MHRTRLLRQEVARHNDMHGAMTHGDGNNLTHWMEGQSKACMLGMKRNMHLWQGKQAWDTTLLRKKEMGGAQSPREQPLKAWSALVWQAYMSRSQTKYACMHV